MKRLIFLVGVISLSLQGMVVSRENVISMAQGYANCNWTVIKINPEYPIYSLSGRNITGESYSYGDKATTSYFQSEINDSLIPRNWLANFNDSTQAIYTGIDCSGLVTRCWYFSENLVNNTNANDLKDYTIPITGEPKAGDLWWKSSHVFLQSVTKGLVYESNPLDDENHSGGNRVQYHQKPSGVYTPRSIFPQFSNEHPEDEEVLEDADTINISLTIKASGTLISGGVSMRVNGDPVSNPDLQPQGDNTWTLTAPDYDVSEGGKFNVLVTARNDVSETGNGYLDEYEWKFVVNQDSTPPMVVFTNPSDGAIDVPVDINQISITFSKVMDTSLTQGAISITPAISYTTSWTNGDKTINLNPDDYLDYCEEYEVKISDDATDTAGVQLDGNKVLT